MVEGDTCIPLHWHATSLRYFSCLNYGLITFFLIVNNGIRNFSAIYWVGEAV